MSRHSRRQAVIHFIVYLAVRVVVFVVQTVSPRIAYILADTVGDAMSRLIRRRSKTALENVCHAFPELASNPAAADALVGAMYRHLARAAVEVILAGRKLRPSTWQRYMSFNEDEKALLLQAFDSKRPVLIVTAHLGNWELAGLAFGLLGYRTYAIARALDNPYLDRYVRRLRCATGQDIIAKHGDFDRLASALAAGGNVATLADQDAGPHGVFVDFFGRPASTHKAVALLALKHDIVLFVGAVPRVPRHCHPPGHGRPAEGLEPMCYAFELGEVIDPRGYAGLPRAAAVRAITAQYTAALERLIRRYPEQYFWLHRRWKTCPPTPTHRWVARAA
jgi:KDO2-lipid IV(A) lauroyltransferase